MQSEDAFYDLCRRHLGDENGRLFLALVTRIEGISGILGMVEAAGIEPEALGVSVVRWPC